MHCLDIFSLKSALELNDLDIICRHDLNFCREKLLVICDILRFSKFQVPRVVGLLFCVRYLHISELLNASKHTYDQLFFSLLE
jgi:hypothetical protein